MAYDPYYIGGGPTIQHQHHNYDTGIDTLFISGLPDDVVAFATFFNHQSAIAALHSLNGVKFDPQTGATLHIELARSNSRRKRGPGKGKIISKTSKWNNNNWKFRTKLLPVLVWCFQFAVLKSVDNVYLCTAGGAYVVIDKRQKTRTDGRETSSDDGDEDHNEQYENDDESSKKGDIAHQASGDTAGYPDGAGVATNEQTEKTIDGEDHACSTLFIANVGPNCSEDELKQVLSQYPGFNMLKLRARSGMPKVEQATDAMQSLQGSLLPSSDRGGMNIDDSINLI
ncbi:hypothetical protein RJ641_024035 [Dillenia turbinata]|uniref:RRM domain-containing protein n=1 Tax=Dillenia turbinata TaxID=194707 RepID=A0AAN8YTB9_9MAGN